MNREGIDPAAWLTEHEIEEGRRPFSYSDDVFALGGDELARCGGDLSRALAARPECRAEIVLAWLAGRALEGPAAAADGVMLAARIVGRLNKPGICG